MINNLPSLYKELDFLFEPMKLYCKQCKDCCTTYGWLLPEEAKFLYEEGIQILEINNQYYCIDSILKDQYGNFKNIELVPICNFYKNFQCTLYKKRPLICRLYPITFKFKNNSILIGLDKDCFFINSISDQKIEKLINNAKKLVKFCRKDFLNKIITTYQNINSLCKPKEYDIIKIISWEP